MIRGKHSRIYFIGPLVVKFFNPGLELNVEKEWRILSRLKPTGYAPRPYLKFRRMVVMERIRGKPIRDMTPVEVKVFAPEFLEAMYVLDKLGIQKEECHRPDKHFIKTLFGPRLIDFERARESKKPSNVTQFLQFLDRYFPGIKKLGRNYKKSYQIQPILEFMIDSEFG